MTVISVIDDDPSVRSATVDLLDSFGFTSEAFASAEAYLASGRLAETSCVILDVRMPGLSGLELQKRLAEAGHTIPVIFITSFPDERMRRQALGAGALCYLPKPYSEPELIRCVRLALGSR